MFYVAKMYKSTNLLIVESFENPEDAASFAEILTRTGKGEHCVLQLLQKECKVKVSFNEKGPVIEQ